MKAEDQDELRVARQAATWLIRLESEDAASQARCTAWLLESSRHVKAFLRASAMSARLDGLDPQHEIDVEALISQAKACVVPLTLDSADGPPAPPELDREDSGWRHAKARKRWRLAGVAVTAALAALVVFWVRPAITRGAETYVTAVGEQRSVKLRDGSLIYLNTNSQVHVRYTPEDRDVQLVQGEALFTVERDPTRPFRVWTGTTVVRAVGTEFDVYRQSARTLIEVVSGEVNVLLAGKESSALPERDPRARAPATPATALLAAGERASVDLDGQIRKNDQRNVQLARNWQQRRLDFEEATLAEVAAEFNRYNRAQIVIEGKELRSLLITATFEADHPQGLFIFLQRNDEHVVVNAKSDEFVVRLAPRDAS